MSEPILCHECGDDIDIHEAGRECLNCSTAKWLGSPIPPCTLTPSDIARALLTAAPTEDEGKK